MRNQKDEQGPNFNHFHTICAILCTKFYETIVDDEKITLCPLLLLLRNSFKYHKHIDEMLLYLWPNILRALVQGAQEDLKTIF